MSSRKKHDDADSPRLPSTEPDVKPSVSTRVPLHFLAWLFGLSVLVLLLLRHAHAFQFILLGLLGTMALAASLQPVVDRLPGPPGLRATLAVFMLLAVVAGLLLVASWTLLTPLRQHLGDWPHTRQGIDNLLTGMAQWLGIDQAVTVDQLGSHVLELLMGGSPGEWISNAMGNLVEALVAIMVTVIAAVYLLAYPSGDLSRRGLKLLPPAHREPTRHAIEELWPQLRGWAVGLALSMITMGLLAGLGFWISGLALALPLAILAGLCQMIPTFGPLITLILASLVAATQGFPQILGVGITYAVAQTFESYILTPLVMHKAVHIQPIVTLFTVVLWGNIFGVTVLILAIPLDLAVWAFLKHHVILTHDHALPPAPGRAD